MKASPIQLEALAAIIAAGYGVLEGGTSARISGRGKARVAPVYLSVRGAPRTWPWSTYAALIKQHLVTNERGRVYPTIAAHTLVAKHVGKVTP